MRLVRSFLPSATLAGEPIAVILIEAVLSASRLSIPFMTLYLVQAHNLDYATAGLFIAVRGLGGLVAVMLAGAAADRFGEKPVMVVLLAGASVSAVAIPGLHSVDTLLLGFFFLGAFVNAVQPAFSSMVVRTIPVRSWTEVYAAEYWALNVGFAITALIGGRIAVHNFDWLFYGEAVGTLAALVLVVKLLPSALPRERRTTVGGADQRALVRAREWLAVISLATRDRLAMALVSSTLLLAICLSQMTSTLPLDMEALGYSPELYGYVIFWNGGMLTLLQIGAGRVIARRNRSRVLALAAVVSAVGYTMIALMPSSILLILLSLTVWTIGEMMDAPVRNSVVTALAKPGSRARYLGLVSAALTIGYCIGPWLGGWVLQAAGRQTLWLSTASCAIACGLIRYAITSRVEHRVARSIDARIDLSGAGSPAPTD